jgi:hypothetical protein
MTALANSSAVSPDAVVLIIVGICVLGLAVVLVAAKAIFAHRDEPAERLDRLLRTILGRAPAGSRQPRQLR